MPTIFFYFDFASPIAYVMFHRLPHVLAGLAWQLHYRPVLQAALRVAEQGQGAAGLAAAIHQPAKPPDDAQALAMRAGLPFRWPVNLAFQSGPWLRMALASSVHGQPSRQVCETLLNAIWQSGQDPDDPTVQQRAWQEATALLPSVRDWHQPAVAQALVEELADIAQAARQQGAWQQSAWAVPSCVLLPDDASRESPQVFAGVEGLPLLREAVRARQGFAVDASGANA
ncbi:MAG: DsbA family protein [Brachymonas sp.]|nr:DsbA family protein [Brachymonas sp.]